jgi:chorismate synthase
MSNNSFGNKFCVTSFGESHGKHIGVIVDGCPSNFKLDLDNIQQELHRRRPGQSEVTTSRTEDDLFEITSGLFEDKTTGAPITIIIPNNNAQPKDYSDLKEAYRPSHADFTYEKKYGNRDFRGGGRSSARITAGWVAAGAVAKQVLTKQFGISITSYVSQIHHISCPKSLSYSSADIETSIVRCPEKLVSDEMIKSIQNAKIQGDSLGGIVSTFINNCPVGVGEPVFEKINAQLAKAMFSINAVKGFQVGSGFDSVLHKGSELNDAWENIDGNFSTSTNNSGGIQGGISNGMPITFDVAFKPTSTIAMEQKTIGSDGTSQSLKASGRHDPCVVPRAVPIVEAMSAIVLLDNLVHDCR